MDAGRAWLQWTVSGFFTMRRYDPIQRYDQGGTGLGEMEQCHDGEYVRFEDAKRMAQDAEKVMRHCRMFLADRRGYHADESLERASIIGGIDAFISANTLITSTQHKQTDPK